MQVRQIKMLGFMRYSDRVDLTLPPTGLVLITGKNGAGKSAFVEGVSYAGWGKTLRGTDPRRAGLQGGVELVTGFGLEATRFWSEGHKNELAIWHRLSSLERRQQGDQQYEFDTVSKAQEHLTGVLGEWDTWRRSCAFSSVDDLSFATATDAERKRLLESLLGLQRFDDALERCRADVKKASQDAGEAGTAVMRIRTAKETAEQSLHALVEVAGKVAPQGDVAVLRQRLAVLEDSLPRAQNHMREEEIAVNAYQRRQGDWESGERTIKSKLRELTGSTHCPVCEREWPDLDQRETKRKELDKQLELHALTKPKVPDPKAAQYARQSAQDAVRGITELKMEIAQIVDAGKQHAEAQDLVKTAKLALLDMEDQLDMETAHELEMTLLRKQLEVVESVLGTKGARSHMLHDALAGLEAIANVWLERIARVDAPLRLKLSPYTEKKTGGTADAISLEIQGAGGGRGYRGASGGEQRRIDVALMLALAQVAQMTDGRVAPTMFFDEVFDALDSAGREAVAAVLDELAQDRCVVVMTHSSELQDLLTPDMRVVVDDGQIKVT